MKTNELKKGDRVLLECGWYATIMDNQRGNIRLADVEGFCREMGTIYAHDIAYFIRPDGERVKIERTPAQEKMRRNYFYSN